MALFDDEMKREQGGWLAIENAIDGLGVGVGPSSNASSRSR